MFFSLSFISLFSWMTHATNFLEVCYVERRTDIQTLTFAILVVFSDFLPLWIVCAHWKISHPSTLSGTYAFVALPKRNNLFVVILECYKTERRIRINVDTTVYRCWHKRSHFFRMCPFKNSWRERAGGGFALSNILI